MITHMRNLARDVVNLVVFQTQLFPIEFDGLVSILQCVKKKVSGGNKFCQESLVSADISFRIKINFFIY